MTTPLNSNLSGISTSDLQLEVSLRTKLIQDAAWKDLKTNPKSKDLWYKAWKFARSNAKNISLGGWYQLSIEIGHMRCANGVLCVRDLPYYNKSNFRSSGMERPVDIQYCTDKFKEIWS